MLWRRCGVLRLDIRISFDSKDNVSNQNLLEACRQDKSRKIQKLGEHERHREQARSHIDCSVHGARVSREFSVGASLLAMAATGVVDNSGFLDFDWALPAIDVALPRTGHSELRLIHILIDG